MDDKEQTYRATIFATWPDGSPCYFPWFSGDGESLAERIRYVSNFAAWDGTRGFIPLAWMTEAEWGDDDSTSWRQKQAESIAAGRIIKQVDGKWTAFGPGAPAQEAQKEQTPFRIGGYYRQRNGVVVRLTEPYGNGGAIAVRVTPFTENNSDSGGARRLSDGLYYNNPKNIKIALIPGELDERGNPTFTATLDRPAPTPKVKAALDLLEQGFKAEPKRAPLDWNKPTEFNNFPGYQSRTINPNWSAPDSGKFADRRRDSPQVNPGHALAAVRQLVR